MEARRLPLGASPTQVAMMRWGETSMPVSSYSSRMAPCSKLSLGWRRPAGGSQVPVLPDRENAGDEIRLQSTPAAEVSILPTTRQVYGPQGRFANRTTYEAI